MRSLRHFRVPLTTVALGLLNAALAAAILWQLFHGTHDENLAAPVRRSDAGRLDLSVAKELTGFESIQSQALFHQSRTFYEEPQAPAVVQPPPDYRLSGSIALPNKPLLALLIHNQTNARIKVAAGEEIEGWHVEEVAPKRVLLKQGARTAEISSTSRQRGGSSSTASLQSTPLPTQGLTIVPSGQPAQQPRSGGMRVLSGGSRSSSVAPYSQEKTISEARLYRPPTQ